jgi:DNA processing protein
VVATKSGSGAANESFSGRPASLFTGQPIVPPLSDHERLVIQELRQDEALQLDELMERLESRMVSGEIFTALFELELAGRIRQMPGKNYLRCM